MKGRIFILVSCLAVALILFTQESALAFENNYDYPGGALVGRRDGVSSAQDCFNICQGTPNCVAFTWVRPNIQGPRGVCWLKGSLSKKVRNNCCISGVVRQVTPDECKWYRKGTTLTCYCKNRQTGQWYVTNPGACPAHKPQPVYGDQTRDCPPGQVWVHSGGAVFGQGSGGGYCGPE